MNQLIRLPLSWKVKQPMLHTISHMMTCGILIVASLIACTSSADVLLHPNSNVTIREEGEFDTAREIMEEEDEEEED